MFAVSLWLSFILLTAIPFSIGRTQEENALLHRKVNLAGLYKYTPDRSKWAPNTPKLANTLTVVHLWSVNCQPCVEEMPEVKTLVEGFRKESRIRFIFILEISRYSEIRGDLQKVRGSLPAVDQYLSTEGRVRGTLPTTAQPLTLLIDRDRVVRQAFIGSLKERHNELLSSIDRLLDNLPSGHTNSHVAAIRPHS